MSGRSAVEDRIEAGRFNSWLYPFYHRGTAVNQWLRRRIRPAGMGLLLLGVVLGCLAGGQASDPVFRLFSFGFSLGCLSLLWLPFRRVRIEVKRDVPAHATVGEPVRIRYHVTNRGRSLRNAWLLETPPDPRPDFERFLLTPEPGESKRNAFDRFFIYYRWNWLCESRLIYEPRPSEQALKLRRGETGSFVAELLPRRRGLVALDDLRVLLPDPLGLYQRCRRVKAPESGLAILPRRYRLPPFELPGSARFQPGGDATSRNAGPSGEFVGLRDYQPGDPPRLIHWKSWARTGRPIVKELEDSFFPRHGLILDTFPEAGDLALFEEAVSVAASFVSSIDTHECLIDLMFISGAERVVTAGRGTGRAESLLEVLAGVESSPRPQFDSLRKLVLRHSEDLAGCLAVFCGWSEERREMLSRISGTGIEIAAIVVCEEVPAARPPGVHFVRASHPAEDLMRLPGKL
ncbi:DUF58 domain-containing protein [Haloferula sp. A504]|uniref:DUF58 domain-containing protein n=1 Tax=Haloferula sp. A504 TaxID=3373601 RepID=UPI0031C3A4BF|nr:DUF58 domain-containing protein [Verrucomicrobiaceae bacterium E54]